MKAMFRRVFCVLLVLASLCPFVQAEETSLTPREQLIEDILAEAKALFDNAKGRPQRAYYSGDIYVCKNFTVHCFETAADDYRMANLPDIPLIVPANLPKAECKDYVYGVEWMDVPAEEGNPFYVAATFRYDNSLTKKENQQRAREFMMQCQRGDYFQMAANYVHGVGAHSMMITGDYNPDTDTILWADSNMKGTRKSDGVRYGYVQFDAEKDIDWFVDAFCRKKYGATIYRLRDDIVKIGN